MIFCKIKCHLVFCSIFSASYTDFPSSFGDSSIATSITIESLLIMSKFKLVIVSVALMKHFRRNPVAKLKAVRWQKHYIWPKYNYVWWSMTKWWCYLFLGLKHFANMALLTFQFGDLSKYGVAYRAFLLVKPQCWHNWKASVAAWLADGFRDRGHGQWPISVYCSVVYLQEILVIDKPKHYWHESIQLINISQLADDFYHKFLRQQANEAKRSKLKGEEYQCRRP